MREFTNERFYVVPLDARLRPCGISEVSAGTIDATLITPRQVFAIGILCNAHALAIAHNHPSGDPMPSPADIEVTRRMVDAGKLLCVPVIEHMIIGASGYYSIRNAHPEIWA